MWHVSSEKVMGGLLRTYVDDQGNVADELIADVEPIIDLNKKAMNNDAPAHALQGDGWKLIARIPLAIAEKWRNELGVDVLKKDHEQKVEQLLNDPDWRYLKTTWETL